jgi:hypothetical protein
MYIHNVHGGFHWYLVQKSIIIGTVKWIHWRYTGFQSTQRTDMLVPASKKWGYETWRVGSQPQEVGPCWCWWTTNMGCEAMNWSNIGPVFCRKCPVIFRVLDTHICGGLHRHPQRLRDNSIDMDHYSHVHFTEKRGWANSPVTHRMAAVSFDSPNQLL